jgi:uncharacterized alkaline shock family protein YloU
MSRIILSNEAIESIIVNGVLSVEGILDTWKGLKEYCPLLKKEKGPHGVEFKVEGEEISITIYLIAKYGYSLKEVGKEAQKAVKDRVENLTPFTVKEVNVIFEDVKNEG